MNATTGNLPKLFFRAVKKEFEHGSVVILVLVIIFTIFAVLGEQIHQALDPAYRQEVREAENSQKQLDEALKEIEKKHR